MFHNILNPYHSIKLTCILQELKLNDMKPLEMIQKELKILIRCREKSIISFKNGSISPELHSTHISNLTPLISEFEKAIEKLKN